MPTLNLLVSTLIAAREAMVKDLPVVLETLKDQSIPLDERWQAYTDLVENDILVKDKPYGDGFLDTLGSDLTMYDDFYTDRGQTMSFPDMYERIMDEWASDSLKEARENLAAWQEQVLASGYSSFTYDW